MIKEYRTYFEQDDEDFSKAVNALCKNGWAVNKFCAVYHGAYEEITRIAFMEKEVSDE